MLKELILEALLSSRQVLILALIQTLVDLGNDGSSDLKKAATSGLHDCLSLDPPGAATIFPTEKPVSRCPVGGLRGAHVWPDCRFEGFRVAVGQCPGGPGAVAAPNP